MRPWTVTYINTFTGKFEVTEYLSGPMDPLKAWVYAMGKLPAGCVVASMVPGCHASYTITTSSCPELQSVDPVEVN